jgi:hypothetical protein
MSDLDQARVRILRNLKISEISSVDRGAGDGCRVVLFKRDTPDNDDDDDESYAAALRFLMHTPHGAGLVHRLFPQGASGTADIEHLARLVAHVMRAGNSDDAEPTDPHQPWLDGIDDKTVTEKVHHMDREEVLKAAVRRDGGVVPLCKRICAHGAGDITEAELTGMLTEHAQQLYPEMSPSSAFSKLFMSPGAEPLRRAVQIAKGMLHIEPQVSGDDVDANDATRAYEQLQRLATEHRKRSPFLKAEQAFDRATRERPDLLARAVPRRY